jgi:molybdate transport system permease protein
VPISVPVVCRQLFVAHSRHSDRLFISALIALGGSYVLLIVLLILADIAFTSPTHVFHALAKPEIQAATRLTLITCTISAILSLWVAIPLGYLLSRFAFRGRAIIDGLIDIPIVLPPMVLGLSLLILFNHVRLGGVSLEEFLQDRLHVQVTFAIPAVILAQFTAAAAFAVRTMRVAFDEIDPRTELVAMTLGCSRMQGFWRITLPQAWRGMVTAFTLAWSRSLGEFGPIYVFAGTTRMKTEVLSSTVFLEFNASQLQSAVAVSLLMVAIAAAILTIVRLFGGVQSSKFRVQG